MVICCGRLVVVSSIPPGDFFFVFLGKSAVLGGNRRAARQFESTRKSDRWVYSHGSGKHTQTPKIALLALETTRFAIAVWALGALFWAYGQIRAAGRDVNSR